MSAQQTASHMKVRIVNSSTSYVSIETETSQLDVLLDRAKSAPDSLQASAAELREQAKRLLRRAALINRAEIELRTKEILEATK